ncbi:MAG TPA: MBL fold metallo-hydrolase [Candidatus Polarisedimenticolia bacterium]|nr:MBL fold metallo-hydrolase [Candidatus Polarisedimenticolia bacterium]
MHRDQWRDILLSPPDWFFSNVPPQRWESSLRDHNLSLTQVVSPYTGLVIKARQHNVLVDTGGDGHAPATGDLRNLKSEGITPEEITKVILTQAHLDHIGGVLDTSGNPAFANAPYVMSKQNGISEPPHPTRAAREWRTT